MSARRLLGYVVKLPDGTRSKRTVVPTTFPVASRVRDGEALASYVCPVFATRKPKPAPPGDPCGACAWCRYWQRANR